MTKIKDTKIAEKLPSTGNGFTLGAKQDVLNTNIDANECCEVDVEKVTKILTRMGIMGARQTIAEAIAKAGIIKWREK